VVSNGGAGITQRIGEIAVN